MKEHPLLSKSETGKALKKIIKLSHRIRDVIISLFWFSVCQHTDWDQDAWEQQGIPASETGYVLLHTFICQHIWLAERHASNRVYLQAQMGVFTSSHLYLSTSCIPDWLILVFNISVNRYREEETWEKQGILTVPPLHTFTLQSTLHKLAILKLSSRLVHAACKY